MHSGTRDGRAPPVPLRRCPPVRPDVGRKAVASLRHTLLLALGLFAGCGGEFSSRNDATLAITHVAVIDLDSGRVVPDQTVLIRNTRIDAVGTGPMPVPTDARVVDGRGAYLMPGLIDAHVHLFNNVSRRPPSMWAFPLFIAAGVTGVREMWVELEQMTTVEEWRRAVDEGELVGPRVLAAGALVDGPRSWVPNAPHVVTPDEGRRFVQEAVRADADFVKVYSLLDAETYRAIMEESTRLGIYVAGHVPLRARALDAARLGQRTNEHLHQIREACSTIESELVEERERFYASEHTEEEEWELLDAQLHRATRRYDPETCHTVARGLARADLVQVPNLVNQWRWFFGAPSGLVDDDRLSYLPTFIRDDWLRTVDEGTVDTYSGDPADLDRGWEVTQRVVGVMSDSGVAMMAGTDFGGPFILPGFSLHDELALLVEAGLSPLEAIRAATSVPARVLGADDSLGAVAPGKVADLVLLDANPLEDVRYTERVRAVVLGGRYFDRAALDALLAVARAGGRER